MSSMVKALIVVAGVFYAAAAIFVFIVVAGGQIG